MTNHESRLGCRDAVEQLQCAEIAVAHSQVVSLDGLEKFIQRRTFLSMSIFDRKKVDNRLESRIEHSEAFAGQWCGRDVSCFREPVLSLGKWLPSNMPVRYQGTSF